MDFDVLSRRVIGCAIQVHRTLGAGFVESVYQKALAHELGKAGIGVECERRIRVYYDGVDVGDFVADMVADGVLLIENKAVQALQTAHEVQLVNYLTATGVDSGLLLNFGSARLEVKRKYRQPKDVPIGDL